MLYPLLSITSGRCLFWTAYVLLVSATIIYSYLVATFDYFNERGILGPRPLPLFGNLLDVWTSAKQLGHELLIDWHTKYGRLYGIYEGRAPNLVVAEPFLFKTILEDPMKFPHRKLMPGWNLHPSVTNNILFMNGDLWRMTRHNYQSMFCPERTESLKLQIHCCAASTAASFADFVFIDKRVVNIKWAMDKYFKELVCACGLGIPAIDTADFYLSWGSSMSEIMLPTPGEGTINIFKYLFPDWGRHIWPIDTSKDIVGLIDVCYRLVEERKNKVETMEDPHNFLDMCLITMGGAYIQDPDLFVSQIVAMVLMAYNHAISGSMMTLHYLSLNKDIQDKLREKLNESLEENGRNDQNVCSRVHYLEQCILEAMRLMPPVFKLDRVCEETYVNKEKAIKIEKGCKITIPIAAIHRDQELFPKPDEYNPDRFSPENVANGSKAHYMPFGVGARECISQVYAMDIMKETVGQLLLKCKVYPESDIIEDPDPEIDPDPLEFEGGLKSMIVVNNMWLGVERILAEGEVPISSIDIDQEF